ncbi:CNN1 protein, partial [Himantopus himantopus]|nr:CNN1 protein [Himantopus himantopus]
QLAQKYDPQRERELRAWIEGTTGRRIGDSFMDGLKDGVILCELINKLQPGSVQKVNEPVQNWHKLENIGNFLRAITRYGVKPHDIFEANDLFENTNHTQVQSTLIALASQVTLLGWDGGLGGPLGVPRGAGESPRRESGRPPRAVAGAGNGGGPQHSELWCADGHLERLKDPLWRTRDLRRGPGDSPPVPRGGVGTPGEAEAAVPSAAPPSPAQAGMTAPGTKRQIFEPALGMERCDTMTIGLQMGSNKGASQQGMTVYGLPRQVYDPKYCGGP